MPLCRTHSPGLYTSNSMPSTISLIIDCVAALILSSSSFSRSAAFSAASRARSAAALSASEPPAAAAATAWLALAPAAEPFLLGFFLR